MLSYVGRHVRIQLDTDLSLQVRRQGNEATSFKAEDSQGNLIALGSFAISGQGAKVSPSADGALHFFIYNDNNELIETATIHYHSNLIKRIIERTHRAICNCCYENCNQCDSDDCCDICEELLKTTSLLSSFVAYLGHLDIVTREVIDKNLESVLQFYLYEDIQGYTSYPIDQLHELLCKAYATLIQHVLEHSVFNFNSLPPSTKDIDAFLKNTFLLGEIEECLGCHCDVPYIINEISVHFNSCYACGYSATINLEFDGEYNIFVTENVNAGQSKIIRLYSINRKLDDAQIFSKNNVICVSPSYNIPKLSLTHDGVNIHVFAECVHTPSEKEVVVEWTHDKSTLNFFCQCDAVLELHIEAISDDDEVRGVPPACQYHHVIETVFNGQETVSIGSDSNCYIPIKYRVYYLPKTFYGNECNDCVLVGGQIAIYDDNNNLVATNTIPTNINNVVVVGEFTAAQLGRIDIDIEYSLSSDSSCVCDCSDYDETLTYTHYEPMYNSCACDVTIEAVYRVVHSDGTISYITHTVTIPANGIYVDSVSDTYLSNQPQPVITLYSYSIVSPQKCGPETILASRKSVRLICSQDPVFCKEYSFYYNLDCRFDSHVSVVVTYLIENLDGQTYTETRTLTISSQSYVDTLSLCYRYNEPTVSIQNVVVGPNDNININYNNVDIQCCYDCARGGSSGYYPVIHNNSRCNVTITGYKCSDSTEFTPLIPNVTISPGQRASMIINCCYITNLQFTAEGCPYALNIILDECTKEVYISESVDVGSDPIGN
ncbi:MAG: hypothetical protein KatS3mg083_524 [Candidatus Dojkabacteria bacterium]|nr:MAG: hypothetical protein KatS3mg083_524 [Candidatus Dojkabacteria bacterium]